MQCYLLKMKRFIFGCSHKPIISNIRITEKVESSFNPFSLLGFIVGPGWYDGDGFDRTTYQIAETKCQKCNMHITLKRIKGVDTWPRPENFKSLPVRIWKNETFSNIRFFGIPLIVVGGLVYFAGVGMYYKFSKKVYHQKINEIKN